MGLFGDTILTAAMVDRLTNKANVVQIIGESYRIKQTNEWLKTN
ncbi:MAG: ATP-binding protein [Bacilli bacterium]|nr:ATP-binding protein [Bacilli bacterium]